MKSHSFLRFASALALSCLTTSMVRADDSAPPYIVKPVDSFTVAAGTASSVIKLKKTFGLTGVTGPLVRYSTSKGNIDVELYQTSAPQTVAAFLKYAETSGDNNSGTASYTNTLIQRSVAGFIVQGGGFYLNSSNSVIGITGRSAIPGEAGIKNTRGTLALALSNGPDSGVGDYFFNIADNAILDGTADGGPFTVFGHVVGSLSTLDAIAALPNQDLTSVLGGNGAFQNVPLVSFDGNIYDIKPADLVYTNTISPVAVVPKKEGDASILTLKVKSSNPALMNATLLGQKLTLTYTPGVTGASTIKVKAVNPATGSNVKAKFTVTVQ